VDRCRRTRLAERRTVVVVVEMTAGRVSAAISRLRRCGGGTSSGDDAGLDVADNATLDVADRGDGEQSERRRMSSEGVDGCAAREEAAAPTGSRSRGPTLFHRRFRLASPKAAGQGAAG
jgi:hypothetical protein